jgi:excisionase family DNA binding protein
MATVSPQPPPRRTLLGAYVEGSAAFLLERFLDPEIEDRLAGLARGGAHPEHLRAVRRAMAQIREAARQWQELQLAACVSANAQGPPAQAVSGSGTEVSTREAADMLGRTASRVRQLISEGALTGRRVGREWLVDRGSVETLVEIRRAA